MYYSKYIALINILFLLPERPTHNHNSSSCRKQMQCDHVSFLCFFILLLKKKKKKCFLFFHLHIFHSFGMPFENQFFLKSRFTTHEYCNGFKSKKQP